MPISIPRGTGLLVCLLTFLVPGAVAGTAEDMAIERMATCQDSWLDWQKDDPARLKPLGEHIRAGFTHKDNDPFVTPKSHVSIAGLSVAQVYPGSVGMGVGFSVAVDATFDTAHRAFERVLGKRLQKCETSDGMRTCELDIAEKRTFTLMAQDGPNKTPTLVGCYYYYEK